MTFPKKSVSADKNTDAGYLDISAWLQNNMSMELPLVTTEMYRRPGRPNEYMNKSSLSHNKQKAASREATEQTLEHRQGRQRFPRTFRALHFPMLTARALTQHHYRCDQVVRQLLMTYREKPLCSERCLSSVLSSHQML